MLIGNTVFFSETPIGILNMGQVFLIATEHIKSSRKNIER